MARAPQRYIAPDAIYEDLQHRPRTEMARQFPFSWNPVNGLGAASSNAGDQFLNLIRNVGSGVVEDTKKSVEERASSGADEFLRSGPGKTLLEAVEKKAADGVTKVVKKQAPNLMLLAVAGGAIGGALSEKLGKAGTLGALALALWAGKQILDAGKAPAK